MTPERFRDILELACWGSRDLGTILRIDDRLIRRMRGGAEEIPLAVAAWLEDVARLVDAAPTRRPRAPSPHVQQPL